MIENSIKYLVVVSAIMIQGEDKRSLLIKKGNREILLEFACEEQTEMVVQLLDKAKSPISLDGLISEFPIEQRKEIQEIIHRFLSLNILVETLDSDITNRVLNHNFEQAIENYFWEQNISWADFLRYEENVCISIVGLNNMGMQIAELLRKMGIFNVEIVDYPYLRNKQYEKQDKNHIDFIEFNRFLSNKNRKKSLILVVDEIGNISSLLRLNQIFFNEGLSFLPLFILSQNGYIGPLVVPGKTSCFHCLLSRLEDTTGKLNLFEGTELEYYDWQVHSSTHPSVIAILAHFFVFQLTTNIRHALKISMDKIPNLNLQKRAHDLALNYCNSVTEVDLLMPQIYKRRILRKPNCPCCRSLMARQKIVFDFTKEYAS